MRRLIAGLLLALWASAASAFTYDSNGNLLVTTGTSSGTGGALAPTGTAAGTNAVLKNAPGNLYDAYVTNATGAAGYLYAINATSLPSNGAISFGTGSGNYQDCVYVPNNATVSIGASPPESFSIGVTIAFSSAACGTLTATNATLIRGRAF